MPLIHQITLGKEIPPLNRECLSSWRSLNDHGFQLVTWTDRSASDFLAACPVAEAKRVYERARNYGEASDILRMAVAYCHGGLYVDWDVLLVDPARFLAVLPDVASSNCILLRDQDTKDPAFPCIYDNSLFYMKKGHPLALDFLREMEQNYAKRPIPNTPYLTGPLALTSFLDLHPRHKADCSMVDIRDVYALDYSQVIERTGEYGNREVLRTSGTSGGAPAIHFWMHTWVTRPKWMTRVLNRVSKTLWLATRTRSQ
jgi:mannosyltransferase OCH1-like enzyme